MSYHPPYPRPAAGRPMSAAERLHVERYPAPPALSSVKFLNADEVAVILRVSKMTVYRLFHENAFPGSARIGRGNNTIRIAEAGVATYLAGAIEEQTNRSSVQR